MPSVMSSMGAAASNALMTAIATRLLRLIIGMLVQRISTLVNFCERNAYMYACIIYNIIIIILYICVCIYIYIFAVYNQLHIIPYMIIITYARTHALTHTHARTHTRTHARTHAHTHTQTHVGVPKHKRHNSVAISCLSHSTYSLTHVYICK